MKILGLLFLFLGVLALMSHARKPETWQWMWQGQEQKKGQEKASQAADATPGTDSAAGRVPDGSQQVTPLRADVNTRPARQHTAEQAPGAPLVTSSPQRAAGNREEERSWAANVETAQLDGWDHVLRRLSKPQQELLQRGLWRRRHNQPLTNDEQAEWHALLQRLGEGWEDYQTRALLSVAQDDGQLTASQKRLSREIIQVLKSLWEERSATLAALAKSSRLTNQQKDVLSDLQDLFDQRALSRVEDNTVLRAAETEAWYRCWEQLRAQSPESLAQATGPLTFVQLFSQPQEFRGQLVKVTGTARWGYRVVSREKRWGIDSYIVLGILPGKGTSSPLVAYCLDLPAGFPAIRAADSLEKGSPLDEDVEVTGFFFKRWLHSSAGGMNLSPLILGQITHWEPSRKSVGHTPTAGNARWAGPLAILATALLGGGIAAWVYRSSRWSSADLARWPPSPTVLPAFDPTHVQGNTRETLRDMARSEFPREDNDTDKGSD